MKKAILIIIAAATLAGCQTVAEGWRETFPAASTPPPSSATPSPTAVETLPNAASSGLAPAQQQLLEIERRLAAAAQSQGLASALATVVDPYDGFVVRPGAVYTGAEIGGALAPSGSGAGPVFWQADRVFVSNDQTMGLTSGRYVQVVTGAEAIQGRYLVVWRREPGGDWKALSETRIQDPPPPPPAPAPAARRRR